MRRVMAAGILLGVTVAGDAAAADLVALIERARTAARRNDTAAVTQALEDALQEARRAAPLIAEPFAVVAEKAPYYGGYVPRKDAVFQGDEPMRFYLEPKNLAYARNEEGVYAPGLAVDLEIRDSAGNSLGRQERFGVFRFASRSALQDIYANLEVTMTGAPAGEYEVRFVIHDLNSPKTVTVAKKITRR